MARGPFSETFDAILINAGVTHPHESWFDALAPGGRIVLPLTVAMGATIGKGVVVRVTKNVDGACEASLVTMVAIYSALGLRDEALNGALGQALRHEPVSAAQSSAPRCARAGRFMLVARFDLLLFSRVIAPGGRAWGRRYNTVVLQTVFLDAGGVLLFPNWTRVSTALAGHGVNVSADALSRRNHGRESNSTIGGLSARPPTRAVAGCSSI